MMLYRCLVLLLLSTFAFGQTTPPAKPPAAPAHSPANAAPAPKTAAPQELPPTAPVLTLVGMCDHPAAAAPKPADCKTVITRAQFEKLVQAVNPTMPMSVRQQLAITLGRVMVAAHEAEKMGLQNKPETQELVHYARTQALAQALLIALQDKFSHSTPAEIQKYYDDNKSQFEEATLKRVYIPKPRAEGKEVNPAAAQAEAEKIHQEAVAGVDFDKLQKEAFQAAGIDATPPPTNIGSVKLATMPDAHKAVFDLKPGGISPLIPDSNGSYVYQLVSKQMVPIAQAKESIEKTLQAEKMEHALQQMSESVKPELNPAYFGPGAAQPDGESRTRPARPAGPGAPKPAQKPPASPSGAAKQ